MEIDGSFLPSKCQMYDVKPEDIKIRTMKGKDEKLLAELNLDNIEKKYATLLKNLVTGIDVNKLTLGDRTWIILWLRANSVSNIYPVTVMCQTCFDKINVDVDLCSIPEKPLQISPESLQVTLTEGDNKNTVLKLKLFRIEDEIKAVEADKKNGLEESYLYKYALSIDDDRDIPKRIAFLENMEQKDLLKIKKFHTDMNHGPELDKVPYDCPKCGSKGVLSLPFRPNFLLPTGDEIK